MARDKAAPVKFVRFFKEAQAEQPAGRASDASGSSRLEPPPVKSTGVPLARLVRALHEMGVGLAPNEVSATALHNPTNWRKKNREREKANEKKREEMSNAFQFSIPSPLSVHRLIYSHFPIPRNTRDLLHWFAVCVAGAYLARAARHRRKRRDKPG